MSFVQALMLFGVPLVCFFGLLMWRGRERTKGWKPLPRQTIKPNPVSKVQAEIAALARLSSRLSHTPQPAPATERPGVFNLPARWEIEYIDADGEITHRVIRIQHLDLRHMQIEAYCETRKADRTFKIRNIKRACDPRTGSGVDVKEYVEEVRWERRARR